MPIKCGVIGKPIQHSLSPMIHQLFAKQAGLSLSYEKIEGDKLRMEEQVTRFFEEGGRGLNVTLPFKERAFDLSQKKTPRSQQAKASNTLWMNEGNLYGDNTDGVGLITAIHPYLNLSNKKVLIVGAGGAARGIIGPLFAAGVKELYLTNRTFHKTKALLHDFPDLNCQPMTSLTTSFEVLINATSASLYNADFNFLSHLLISKPFCYDLAYKLNEPTAFVSYARSHQCEAMDGLGMLVEQAAESFYIWHGFKAETLPVISAIKQLDFRA